MMWPRAAIQADITAAPAWRVRYLMIGDSVSLGMHQQVFDMLEDKLESYHSPGNADNANVGAHSVRRWLLTTPPGTKWDVRSNRIAWFNRRL